MKEERGGAILLVTHERSPPVLPLRDDSGCDSSSSRALPSEHQTRRRLLPRPRLPTRHRSGPGHGRLACSALGGRPRASHRTAPSVFGTRRVSHFPFLPRAHGILTTGDGRIHARQAASERGRMPTHRTPPVTSHPSSRSSARESTQDIREAHGIGTKSKTAPKREPSPALRSSAALGCTPRRQWAAPGSVLLGGVCCSEVSLLLGGDGPGGHAGHGTGQHPGCCDCGKVSRGLGAQLFLNLSFSARCRVSPRWRWHRQ